jgi:hypothetical protein
VRSWAASDERGDGFGRRARRGRLILERMGISREDLLRDAVDRPQAPTFAQYVPVVTAAVSAGTRRVYSSSWNRLVEHWGARRPDEPTPSEAEQFAECVREHVVKCRCCSTPRTSPIGRPAEQSRADVRLRPHAARAIHPVGHDR